MDHQSIKPELIRVTKDLISFRTVSGNHKEVQRSFTYIKRYLKPVKGLFVKQTTHKGFHSLLISTTRSHEGTFDVILHGHIDVVPAEVDEFVPKETNEKIYGRGATDMKSGCAALLVYMKHEAYKTGKRILLLITSDEEIGSANGTEILFETLKLQSSFFLTAEGERQWMIKAHQKGVLMVKISVPGIGEHSSYPWKGKNAILRLVKMYQEIDALFPPKKDSNHWYTTVNLSKILGGTALNVIPDYAEASLDIRFCEPWKSPDQVIQAIKPIVKKYGGSLETILEAYPMNTDTSSASLKRFHTIAQGELKTKRRLFVKNHGTNDARFAAKHEIASVAFGPVGGNYHTTGEYVEIPSLVTFYTILTRYLNS